MSEQHRLPLDDISVPCILGFIYNNNISGYHCVRINSRLTHPSILFQSELTQD